MAQLKNPAWQYLSCSVAFFATHGEALFFNIQKETVRSGAYSWKLSTSWYEFTPPDRGEWHEKY